MSQTMTIPFDDHEIGQGFNSETREKVGCALSCDGIGENPDVDGQLVRTNFEYVTTQENLMEAMGISAAADVRYGLFSGDMKMKFAESHSVNSFSSFIAGRCVVRNAARHGHGFRLTEDAQALVASQRMPEYKTAFGDMFVRSMKTGGEFYVVVRITSVNEHHQTELSASLHAEYNALAASGSFQAKFDTAMTETQGKTEVTVFMSQAGGIGSQAAFTGSDAAKILERLSDFPAIVHQHPVGYEVELASYNTLPIPVPTAEEQQDRELVLQDCYAQKLGFLKAKSDLNFMLGEKASLFFESLPPQKELVRIQAEYQAALTALIAHAAEVAKGRMNPPKMFVASPIPTPLDFKKQQLPIAEEDALSARGAALANQDALAMQLRAALADDASRRGFNVAYAVDGSGTQPGPGKDKYRDALPADERTGFEAAVAYFIERNRHLEQAITGARIAKANPAVEAARSSNAASATYRLGFDIATGLFGDPALGAVGSTAWGPGSTAIRDALSSEAKAGFNASAKLHLGPPPLPRRT